MKRISMIGLAFVAVSAFGGVATEPASAWCRRVKPGEASTYSEHVWWWGCKGTATTNGYIKTETRRGLATSETGILCYRVYPATEPSKWANNVCSTEQPANERTGGFAKIEEPSGKSEAEEEETTPFFDTVLSAETYPIILQGEAKAESGHEKSLALQNEVSELPAGSVSALLTISELSSLGALHLDFAEVHESGKPSETCKTEGEAAGVVLISGELRLALSNSEPDVLSALITFPTLTITCTSGLKVKVEAPNLGRLALVAKEGDSESIEAISHCSAKPGIAEVSSFLNEAGELGKETALLKANFGAGNTDACEEVKPTVLLSIEKGVGSASMFTVLP